jgi:MFS family permease
VLGCVFIGILVDRYHVTTVILGSTIGAVVSVLVFWGLATSLELLLIFSAAYGFFAGS